MPVFKIKSIDDLYDHIGYVVLRAPDRFPVEDYLPTDEQMTLERAFEQLRQGVEFAYPDDFHPEKRAALNELLDRSFTAYKGGSEVEGAHLLQDFQDAIFKSPK